MLLLFIIAIPGRYARRQAGTHARRHLVFPRAHVYVLRTSRVLTLHSCVHTSHQYICLLTLTEPNCVTGISLQHKNMKLTIYPLYGVKCLPFWLVFEFYTDMPVMSEMAIHAFKAKMNLFFYNISMVIC